MIKSWQRTILVFSILLIVFNLNVNAILYQCFADSTKPSTCNTNGLNTRVCPNIVDCLKYLQSIQNLNSTSQFKISLPNAYYSSSTSCNLSFSFSIGLTISNVGQQTPIVDCQYQSSFIKDSSSLTINGLHITNAINSAITSPPSQSVLSIYQSTFTNCSGPNGGALSITYPTSLTVYFSFFINNTATTGVGGAIYASTANIFRSSFSNNTAAQQGGAIFSEELTVQNTGFIGNHVVNGGGGAIYSLDSHITGSTLRNNYAQQGGAINSEFIGMDTNYMYGNSAEQGGAIYLRSSIRSNELTNSLLYNNTASSDGGAMYIDSASPQSSLDLTKSSIYNNTATNIGGAFYFNKTSTGFLFNGQVYNNTVLNTKYADNPISQEYGCDDSSFVNCNFCSSANCNVCEKNKGICLREPGDQETELTKKKKGGGSEDTGPVLCLLSSFGCDHGTCSLIANDTFTCACDSGYSGSKCNNGGSSASSNSSSSDSSHPSPSPSPTPKPSKSKKDRALAISLPIVFSILGIMFIVVVYLILKKKKQQTHEYSALPIQVE